MDNVNLNNDEAIIHTT
jgi:hypothetical protein